MSALAGLWNFDGRPDAGELCGRMLAAQRIYGPHAGAQWDDGAVALGRRLYRLLPEDAYDVQPLAGAGGRFALVADLRLDNREELARELRIDPPAARRLADSAMLLAAWERWEDAVFDHLLGDYAFALWDAREHRLTLARDALGGRPLHYHRGKDFIAFASMPKGLHALADVPYAPDAVRAAEFLALLPESGPRSFFQDISRVESGHMVVVTRDRIVATRHWQPRRERLPAFRPQDHVEGMRAHLDRAVGARLRGAGDRVGAHLSAGLDSAAVAATAARLTAPSGGRVTAFTSVPRAGYDGAVPAGRIADESELAAATAALYPNMEHVRVHSDDRTVMDNLDRDFFLFERPLVNACNQRWWNAINAEAARRDVTVLLTGVMGNFTISYGGWQLLPELARQGRWIEWFRQGRALVGAGKARWRGVIAASVGPWVPEAAWRRLNRLGGRGHVDVARYSNLNPERLRAMDMAARADGFDLSYRPRRSGFDFRLRGLRRVDLGNSQKGALAGWGVDLRDPTADRRLIEFSLSLPTDAYLRDGQPRALGIAALADRLPPRLLADRRKGLQAIDWHEGLSADRERIREEIGRLEQVPVAAGALDLRRMRALVEDWPTGDWNLPVVETEYRLALIRGVVSGHFLRKASRTNV